ncbi:hypothetical protein Plhal304r1_c074g0162171 [Plasmopara halstedii]
MFYDSRILKGSAGCIWLDTNKSASLLSLAFFTVVSYSLSSEGEKYNSA